MDSDWQTLIKDQVAESELTIYSTLRSGFNEMDEMCAYVGSSGGKRIRPAMCILSYLACGGDHVTDAVNVGSSLEIIHAASLIHDDINDGGELRRGRKSLYKEYTISKSIIVGDYMFAKAFQLLGTTNPEILDIIIEASSAMCSSEFIQKKYEHAKDVTEENYLSIIRGKTAMLISASAKAGAYLAKTTMEYVDALGDFALNAGIAFQIIDDVLDITGNYKKTGKAIGADIIEGKPTLPLIYAMQDVDYGASFKEIFSKDEVTESDVTDAISIINKTKAIELCYEKADAYFKIAQESLNIIPESIFKDALIDLAHFFAHRDR